MSDELRQLVEAGDPKAMLAFLAKLREPARLKLGPTARAELKRTSAGDFVEKPKGSFRWQRDLPQELHDAALVATFGTLSEGELAKLAKGWDLRGSEDVDPIDVWRKLRPGWLRRAADIIVAENVTWWELADRLYVEGLSNRPTHENYVLGMVTRGFNPRRGPLSPKSEVDRSLADRVLQSPHLLKEEVWRLFKVEGGGENSLAAYEKYCRDGGWSDALVELARGRHLSRERLLDASLSALERDFAAFRAGWFSRFHEQLEPTAKERRERLPIYARLLSNSLPATASFAVAAIKEIERATPLAGSDLVPHVGRVLSGAQKGPAKEVLALLAKIARREPKAHAAIAKATALALSHGAADVQKAALDLLDELKDAVDAETASVIGSRAPSLAATVRKRAAAWGRASPPSPIRPDVRAVVSERAQGNAGVVPVNALEELVDLCVQVLEDDGDPLKIERVIDGVSRLGSERPDNFDILTGALRKRAVKVAIKDPYQLKLRNDVAALIIAWLERRPPPALELAPQHSLLSFFSTHLHHLATRVATGTAAPLLSLPTHAPAWIAPTALVERVLAWPQDLPALPLDAILALLRLAPDGRTAALKKIAASKVPAQLSELGLALAHALGGEVKIGPDDSLWIAAARARAPYQDDPKVEARHPALGPGAGRTAKLSFGLAVDKLPLATFERFRIRVEPPPPAKAADIPLEHPTVLFYAAPEVECAIWFKEGLRWASTVWPSGMEAFFTEGAHRLAGNLNWHSAYWQHSAYLEPLVRADVPMGPMALLVLALGLAAKEPGEKGLATDAAIAALEQRRLTGEALGATMASLFLLEAPKVPARTHHYGFSVSPKRFAGTLAVVAQASPPHAREVRRAILRSLRGDPERASRDQGALIDLLIELCAETETRIDDPKAAAYLSGGRHKKKVAALLA